jgi:surface antigen
LTSSDTPGSSTNGDGFPTRRDLRARGVAAGAVKPTRTKPTRAVSGAKRRNPLKVVVALVAIPGIFLTAALPAYAFSPSDGAEGMASASRSLTTSQTQGVTVDAGAATLSISRDSFTATTKDELNERAREVQRAAAAAAAQRAVDSARASTSAYAVRGVLAEGDDYPWPYEQIDDNGGGLSPLGYYYRECVDFVAWRLNRDAGSTSGPWAWTWQNLTPSGGNASNWARAWSSKGWPSSKTPVVGSVAWFNYNHVAYVQSVPGDGTVVLEEYNWMGSHAYNTRVVPVSQVPLFLYPPA